VPPAPPFIQAPTLSGPPLLRRISLDLRGRLPEPADYEDYAAGTVTLGDLIDRWSTDDNAPRMLAEAHRLIWRLNGRQMPDLERFAEAGEPGLSAALDAETRAAIIGEPIAIVRRSLANAEPYGSFFTSEGTVAPDRALDFWDVSPGAEEFEGEDISAAAWTDGRPAAGILSAPGTYAALSGEGRSASPARFSHLMARLLCANYESRTAHEFVGIDISDMSDPATLSRTRADCVSCHGSLERGAGLLGGLGSPGSFTNWKNWTTPSGGPFAFSGRSFAGAREFAEFLATDPRPRLCAAKGLFATLMQRPIFNDKDAEALTVGHRAFAANDWDLRSLAAEFVRTEDYRITPIPRTITGDRATSVSGLRLLSRRHLSGLLGSLLPTGTSIAYPEELDPGTEEAAGTTFRMPSGTWFHHASRTIRVAVAAIVAAELADSAAVEDRKLLTELPAGNASGASSDAVAAQISAVWKTLAATDITAANRTAFVEIFNAAGGNASAEASRVSWNAVLIAILLSPGVLNL